MQTLVLVGMNLCLVGTFAFLLTRSNLLLAFSGGKVYLTWLAVAVITLMDEFTSVFYAPAEAHRFLGASAIFFIALTSLLIRFYSTRLVEIAQVLEDNQIIGGGVYSFSYLVLGPSVSFVAVASIMVDYVLTACISSVSAVANATSFLSLGPEAKMALSLAVIWGVAGLNIMGIKDNARFTFIIFILAALVMLNLITLGVFHLDQHAIARLSESLVGASSQVNAGSFLDDFDGFIAAVASCILAYSGVESVLQTAGLVRSWHDIRKAYRFLAFTVGIITPVVAALSLSADIDFHAHEGDLITHYAGQLGGLPFSLLVAVLASLTLIMAVNTAFVASSELLERVAQRYRFHWLAAVNPRDSLYRIHLISAGFFTLIILITHGQQNILADMYALGLIASFCINLGALLIHRYFQGAKDIARPTNRVLTLLLWVVMLGCFVFLALMKPHGTLLWAVTSATVLVLGLGVARRRAPELRRMAATENPMDLVLALAQSDQPEAHLYFMRPREESLANLRDNQAFVSFYQPRRTAPARLGPRHFRLPLRRQGVFQAMVALIKLIEYELGDKTLVVHLGWPMSSWLDRLSIGVMIFNIMRLPRMFPRFHFHIDYLGRFYRPKSSAGVAGGAGKG